MENLGGMEFWHWLILGIVFLVLEVLTPAAIFMWFGFSGLLTGLITWLFPEISYALQILLFAISAVLSILAWKLYKRNSPEPMSPDPELNNRLSTFIGQKYVLTTPIINGKGRIHLGDGTWTILSSDLPAGDQIQITGVKGIQLMVEPVVKEMT